MRSRRVSPIPMRNPGRERDALLPGPAQGLEPYPGVLVGRTVVDPAPLAEPG